MPISTYLLCLGMYVAGILLHLFWLKIPSLKKKAKAIEYEFTMKDWWKHDWNVIMGNIVFCAMLLMGLKQLLLWKPAYTDLIHWIFAFMGAFGNNVVMSKFGKLEKTFQEIFDDKINKLKSQVDTTQTDAEPTNLN